MSSRHLGDIRLNQKETHMPDGRRNLHRTLWLFATMWAVVAASGIYAAAQSVGNCDRALGEAYLDVGNVRARILNTGGLFWRGEPHVYEVPKGSGS
ncbi:MAG: hypothetical protein E2O84_03425, partial [Bacteroidetes bacterium]